LVMRFFLEPISKPHQTRIKGENRGLEIGS
jgi:hypothetical protein